MPSYTLQRDPASGRLKSTLAGNTTYCDDFDDMLAADSPTPAPPPKTGKGGTEAAYHAHPRQQIKDYGPEVRSSKLPIFTQVRSMLQKPPPLRTHFGGNSDKNLAPKWDPYTGEFSEEGKPSSVKPSQYVAPTTPEIRRRSPERPSKSRKNQSSQPRDIAVRRDQSPVSVLYDEDAVPVHLGPQDHYQRSSVSPVSPVSPVYDAIPPENHNMIPRPLSANVRQPQSASSLSAPQQIKRKPAPRSISASENLPPSLAIPQNSPSQASEPDDHMLDEHGPESQRLQSHFSWTTVAPSIAPGRTSTSTDAAPSMAGRMSKPPSIYPERIDSDPQSRFSWSTVNTNMTAMTAHARPDSPPPSSPPPIPEKYAAPQMQSILSRRRPIQRADKEEWEPPARISSKRPTDPASSAERTSTPKSAKSLQPPPLSKDSASSPQSTKSGKALPLPPPLSPGNKLSHLDTLLGQERDLLLQRRNVERGIADLEKVQKASPLEVDFSAVRDAKRKLEEYRKRLDEVKLEERDIGYAISRVRRKEGEEEAFWVRRVTS